MYTQSTELAPFDCLIIRGMIINKRTYHDGQRIVSGSNAFVLTFIHSYSFIANCQTAVVHKNKTKRMSKIYKSQYIFRYNILTVKLRLPKINLYGKYTTKLIAK